MKSEFPLIDCQEVNPSLESFESSTFKFYWLGKNAKNSEILVKFSLLSLTYQNDLDRIHALIFGTCIRSTFRNGFGGFWIQGRMCTWSPHDGLTYSSTKFVWGLKFSFLQIHQKINPFEWTYDTLVRGEFQNEPFRRLGAILPQLGDNWLRVRSADDDTPLRFELRFDRPECGVAHGLFRFQKRIKFKVDGQMG